MRWICSTLSNLTVAGLTSFGSAKDFWIDKGLFDWIAPVVTGAMQWAHNLLDIDICNSTGVNNAGKILSHIPCTGHGNKYPRRSNGETTKNETGLLKSANRVKLQRIKESESTQEKYLFSAEH